MHFLQACMCAQRRLRSACASAQCDQSLRWPPEDSLDPCLSAVPWQGSDHTARMCGLASVFTGRIFMRNAVSRLISYCKMFASLLEGVQTLLLEKEENLVWRKANRNYRAFWKWRNVFQVCQVLLTHVHDSNGSYTRPDYSAHVHNLFLSIWTYAKYKSLNMGDFEHRLKVYTGLMPNGSRKKSPRTSLWWIYVFLSFTINEHISWFSNNNEGKWREITGRKQASLAQKFSRLQLFSFCACVHCNQN